MDSGMLRKMMGAFPGTLSLVWQLDSRALGFMFAVATVSGVALRSAPRLAGHPAGPRSFAERQGSAFRHPIRAAIQTRARGRAGGAVAACC